MSSETVGTRATVERNYAETIGRVTLPDTVLEFVEEYESLGGERDRFVWKWIYQLFPSFTLSSVPPRHEREVRTRKTLFTVFVTFLDDLAEKDGDDETFREIHRAVTQPGAEIEVRADADSEMVDFADRLWTTFADGLSEAPRHDEFREVFRYDLKQALNAIDYSRILNQRVTMANLNGVKHYDSHNMVMFPYADIDIMYSPSFDSRDLGVLRELIWDLQKMARIGNWLTTWEREIEEGDFTAGVVVYALQNDLVTSEELQGANPDRSAVTDRIYTHDVEELFVAEWEQLHRKVRGRDLTAESIDLDAFVDGMETVMEHHLASEGLK